MNSSNLHIFFPPSLTACRIPNSILCCNNIRMGYIYGRYYCENNVSMTCEYVLPPYTLRRSVNIFANVNPTYQINPSLRLSSLIAINIYSVWLFYFYRNNILFIEFWWLLFFSSAWYTISTFRYSDWYSLNFLLFVTVLSVWNA